MNFLEKLKEYFQNNSKEQIKKDWDKSNRFDNSNSPTVKEYINTLRQYVKDNPKLIRLFDGLDYLPIEGTMWVTKGQAEWLLRNIGSDAYNLHVFQDFVFNNSDTSFDYKLRRVNTDVYSIDISVLEESKIGPTIKRLVFDLPYHIKTEKQND